MTATPDPLDPVRCAPCAPCWAVVFRSRLSADTEGYEDAAGRMLERVAEQPGFLGVESQRGADGLGVTISWWASRAAIAAWRNDPAQRAVRAEGRRRWYAEWSVELVRVDRDEGPGPPASGSGRG